jgi:hypothetical protein
MTEDCHRAAARAAYHVPPGSADGSTRAELTDEETATK